jgi:hypothetical protein
MLIRTFSYTRVLAEFSNQPESKKKKASHDVRLKILNGI